MKILITGANGMVAKAVIKHCRDEGDDVSSFTREALDISNYDDIADIVTRETPEVIINCAAFTDVDRSETNRESCYAVNAKGVENLARASRRVDCTFLTISTDYVFDGENKGFYTQRDTPNPINYYGRAKLEGEKLAREAYARSIIVRTGWIFGVGGTNFLSKMHLSLANDKKISAISNSFGTPTFADDLARRIRNLVKLDLPLTFHVANSGEGVSFYEFALEICRLGGFESKLVENSLSESLNRPAARPGNSSLRCLFSNRIGLQELPDWKESLKVFLDQQKNSGT